MKTKEASWSVSFDIISDGEPFCFEDLPINEQERIMELVKNGYESGNTYLEIDTEEWE
jgi:hypothetical protein